LLRQQTVYFADFFCTMDYTADNPFEDNTGGNPFEDQTQPLAAQPPPVNRASRVITAPPPVDRSRKSISPELVAKADKLRKQEEELNRREAVLDKRQQILVDREKDNEKRKPNWPRCKPLIYHNIPEDMPTPEMIRLCRMAYLGWYALEIAFVYNAAALLAVAIATGDRIGDFVLSIVYIVFMSPICFLIYRVLYRAGRKSKPSLFVFYFCVFALEILIKIYFALGISGCGAGGFVLMIDMFNANQTVAAIMILVSFVVWVLLAAFSIWIWILARLRYRALGGMAKAKAEMKDAAVEQAKAHPELVIEGAKLAAQNPDVVAKGVRTVI